MKKLLITAFEPFGGEELNASLLALQRLPEKIGSWEVTKFQVPVVFGLAGEKVIQAAEELKPDAIISLGQAEGQDNVTPELVGINLRNARIPDNDGKQPLRETIVSDGPDAYFSTLPVFEMAAAIKEKNLPGDVSYSAGTFVCNELLYTLLHHYAGTDTKAAFIHVPMTPVQATKGQPSMEADDIAKAIISAIEAI